MDSVNFFFAAPFPKIARCTLFDRFRAPLRLIAGDRCIELTALQTTKTVLRITCDLRCSSLRRIHCRTPLSDRGLGRLEGSLARLHRPDSRHPDGADAVLRIDAGGSGASAVRLADAGARARIGALQLLSEPVRVTQNRLRAGALRARSSLDFDVFLPAKPAYGSVFRLLRHAPSSV
jgi:hypothetical protein